MSTHTNDNNEHPALPDELLMEVAARFGTPTFLYDLTRVTAQAERLQRAFPTARLHYAVKANANGALLRHIANLGMGAEALTLGELERSLRSERSSSLRAGFPPGRILLGGPGITPALANRAVEAGVELVSLDGPGAYEAFRGSQSGEPDAMRFLVRLNPGFDPHTHEHLATAAASSKFGLPQAEAVRLAELVASHGRLAGFHVHAGSMLTDPMVARMVVDSLVPLYDKFPQWQMRL